MWHASGKPQRKKQDISIVHCNSVTGIPHLKPMLKVERKDDTASVETLVPVQVHHQLEPSGMMKRCDPMLQIFPGDKVPVVGAIDVIFRK